jgi:hypothetical protein
VASAFPSFGFLKLAPQALVADFVAGAGVDALRASKPVCLQSIVAVT